MAKGEALKQYKIEQKAQTRKKLEAVIEKLKSSKQKITVSNVATLSGISRASIYANYKDLFTNVTSIQNIKENVSSQKNILKEKDETIGKLREENRDLRDANTKLMDEIIALKMMLKGV